MSEVFKSLATEIKNYILEGVEGEEKKEEVFCFYVGLAIDSILKEDEEAQNG